MSILKALVAAEAPLFTGGLPVPSPHAERMAGMERRTLTGPFGISAFGVAQTRIPAGQISGLHHRHSRRDEFIYVMAGEVVLVGDEGETLLSAGMCAGFPAGSAHHLENRSTAEVVYLDIGTGAVAGDEIEFPDDDLMLAATAPDERPRFVRRNGDSL